MSDNFRCGGCGFTSEKSKDMIAHYRKEHPEDGYRLWDEIGDVGDRLANGALTEYRAKVAHMMQKNDAMYAKAKEFDALLVKYSRLARAASIIDQALLLAQPDDA